MKLHVYIGIVLLAVLAVCNPYPTSPHPSLQGEGEACWALVGIDSLMWQQPDSALAVMMQFAASPQADSLDEFEGHYCQLLNAELLFKNDCAQSNRTEVLKAVSYFDSLVMTNEADARGSSPQGPSRRDASKCEAFDVVNASDKTMAFLDARAHYIKGVGYYERDSLIEVCTEYLNTLRIMESHFGENELVGKKARFMALTYSTESYKSY